MRSNTNCCQHAGGNDCKHGDMMGASLLAAMTVLSDESDADGDDDAVMMGDDGC